MNSLAPASRFNFAVVDSHPVDYKVPLYRLLSSHPAVSLRVFFCDRFGLEGYTDAQLSARLKWDLDLLSGYTSTFIKNWSLRPSPYSFFGEINPGLWKVLSSASFDAVLINGYARFSDWIAIASANWGKVPIIFKGEANLLAPRSLVKSAVKRAILPFVFRSLDAVLYSCHTNKQYFEHYGVPSERLFFAPCAVDNEYFRKEAARLAPFKQALRAELGIPEKAFVVLFVGRFTSWKRPADLLKAYALRPSPYVWLLFVGNGPEGPALRAEAQAKGIRNVTFAGFKNRSEIPKFYGVADALAVPSEVDLSPKVVNEAMNFGLPIIASDKVGTAGDLVKHFDNGFVYRCGDVDSLSHYIEKLAVNPTLRQAMAARSVEIVSEWTVERQAEAVLSALSFVTRVHT